MDRLPDNQSNDLRHLHVRLSGMEGDVELTPGYLAWREKVTRESKLARDEAYRKEHMARRLGSQALEQE